MYFKKEKKKKKKEKEQCDKLLLVLGSVLALTRSYSEIWQVARIGLCGRVQFAARLKFKIVH